jgi:hypothetical protein
MVEHSTSTPMVMLTRQQLQHAGRIAVVFIEQVLKGEQAQPQPTVLQCL